tara:strand:- start:1486 stop:1947 length:462 start_codon:yes stop_codon:yes gene_type:complete
MFNYLKVLYLLFIINNVSYAIEAYDHKYILISNNTDTPITFSEPIHKSVDVHYPNEINPHQQGEIVIDINKEWFIDNPINIKYNQFVFFDQASFELLMTKRTPDPQLLKPFSPGYDCDIINVKTPSNIHVLKLPAARPGYCASLYIYTDSNLG